MGEMAHHAHGRRRVLALDALPRPRWPRCRNVDGLKGNSPNMVKWKNATSYSRDDKDRTPRTWEARLGCVRICVTRRHGLPGWFLICEPWHSLKMLGEISDDEAKKLAETLIAADARALMESLGQN